MDCTAWSSISRNSGDLCESAREVSLGFWKLAAITSSTALGSEVGPGLKLITSSNGTVGLREPKRAGCDFSVTVFIPCSANMPGCLPTVCIGGRSSKGGRQSSCSRVGQRLPLLLMPHRSTRTRFQSAFLQSIDEATFGSDQPTQFGLGAEAGRRNSGFNVLTGHGGRKFHPTRAGLAGFLLDGVEINHS